MTELRWVGFGYCPVRAFHSRGVEPSVAVADWETRASEMESYGVCVGARETKDRRDPPALASLLH